MKGLMNMKRVLAMLLCLSMVLGLVPALALAEESAPRQIAIVRANRYAVDHSDYLIAYVWHAGSNARNILVHAECRETKIHITNLYSQRN